MLQEHEPLPELDVEAEVVCTEIIPPLGDAMVNLSER